MARLGAGSTLLRDVIVNAIKKECEQLPFAAYQSDISACILIGDKKEECSAVNNLVSTSPKVAPGRQGRPSRPCGRACRSANYVPPICFFGSPDEAASFTVMSSKLLLRSAAAQFYTTSGRKYPKGRFKNTRCSGRYLVS